MSKSPSHRGDDMEDFEAELKSDFLQEAVQLLDETESAFLDLESNPEDPKILDGIFRFAHNLKGTSRAVGFSDVAEFTHEVENLILKLKEGVIRVNEKVVNVLLTSNDRIREMIEGLQEDFDKSFQNDDLISKIQECLLPGDDDHQVGSVEEHENESEVMQGHFSEQESGDFESTQPLQTEDDFDISALSDEELGFEDEVNSKESQSPSQSSFSQEPLTDEVSTDNNSTQDLDMEALEAMALENFHKIKSEVIPDQGTNTTGAPEFKKGHNDLVQGQVRESDKKKPSFSNKVAKPEETIRVGLSKVENLNNFVGELVILQSVLTQNNELKSISDKLVAKSLTQLVKISKEIQEISMSLRMVSLKATMTKMARIVRDTSKTLGKDVELVLVGEETEIDKTVLEQVADPLVHIIRNAVDHGIEDPQERVAKGKNPKGEVCIFSYHEGNNLVIEVRDNGKGIDPVSLRQKAISKAIIKESDKLSDQEIIQLIFHPGFSMKDQVTEVSGRGVGMDVVKTNIEKLSGEVSVESVLEKGSVFKIFLPLTLATIEGLVVEVMKNQFIVPLTQVLESLHVKEEDIFWVSGKGECIVLREEVIPLYRVDQLLQIKRDEKHLSDIQTVMVVKDKSAKVAICVDDILHQQQVVVKSLGSEIKDKKGFMGSTILGDGKPSFILDTLELVRTSKISLKKNINKLNKQGDVRESHLSKVA